MKTFIRIISIIVFLFSVSISAQKTTWLDKDLKETSKEKSVYYKVITSNKKVINYFYKTGEVFRKVNLSKRKPVGKFSEFYITGELRVSGKYEKGLEEGIWKTYYKNGKIREKGAYKKGEKVGIWKAYYKNI
jgi:antitoxin component YwqK of YwqJK toxin-antitoxin module